MTFAIGIIIFALIMLYRTVRQRQQQRITKQWLIVWSIVWLLLIVLALAPQTADFLAATVGVGRGADLFVYIAILFLLYAEYRGLVRAKKIQEEQTELVRRIALDHAVLPEGHDT